mmetsp:Transcript_30692/g.48998  ORF Transcript_30692/g.48998 Transcript_30692/m.48998 type:complete len:679 (+) Transcript_30692:65-2101(+)
MAALLHFFLLSLAWSEVQANKVTPIEKVMQMLSDLETQIVAEGGDAQKTYNEYAEFCEDRSRQLGFEIKTGKGEVRDLKAAIEKETADAAALTAKIEDTSEEIATDEADLKAATTIRKKEHLAFLAEEKELMDVVNTLERAITILERESGKGGASMLQTKNVQNVAQALSVMVEASFLSMADSQRLAALVQTSEDSGEDEDAPGAPAAKVYENQSGGVIQTLEDLYSKAQGQLEDARKAETKSVQAFELLEQSLEDSIKFATKKLNEAKKALSVSKEAKATAEGDLDVTSKDLAEDIKDLDTLHTDCMAKAEDFESEVKARGEELKALAAAKKVIEETTSGAASQSYSFVQLTSRADLSKFEAVRVVRDLAKTHRSKSLAQLATRMMQLMQGRSEEQDPFEKVKGLIRAMIEKLEEEAEADATEKAYCDKEMAETQTKQDDKESAIEKLTTNIEGASAKVKQLKQEVATLQKELAALAKAQAEMDKLRAEEKAAFEVNSAEMKKGVEGVKIALKILNEYYAKDAKEDASYESKEGAGAGIIGLLEVCEADFSKGLAEMIATEEAAASEYDKLTKENEIDKAKKTQDVKYKTKELKGLEKSITEMTTDRSTVQEELDAVNEYFDGIKKRCIAKPETYEERVKRRSSEIAGLKEALSILDGEAVLLQTKSRRTLRGVKLH